MTIPKQIRRARENAGLIQRRAAEALDISYVHLCCVENGEHKPSLKLLQAMAKLYKTTFIVGTS